MNKRRKNGIYYLGPNHLLLCKINQARSIGPYVFYSSGIQHASNKHKSNYGVPSHVRDPMSDTKQHYTQRTHFQAWRLQKTVDIILFKHIILSVMKLKFTEFDLSKIEKWQVTYTLYIPCAKYFMCIISFNAQNHTLK